MLTQKTRGRVLIGALAAMVGMGVLTAAAPARADRADGDRAYTSRRDDRSVYRSVARDRADGAQGRWANQEGRRGEVRRNDGDDHGFRARDDREHRSFRDRNRERDRVSGWDARRLPADDCR